MSGIIKVLARGLLAVCGVTLVVAALWSAYIQREALASALAPAAELVNNLRGVSEAPDSEPASAPRVVPPPQAAPAEPAADVPSPATPASN